MPEDKQQPTERTPKGLEVPIPEQREFFANLKKVAEPDKLVEADEDTEPPQGDPLHS
jgi:hypothetical protein